MDLQYNQNCSHWSGLSIPKALKKDPCSWNAAARSGIIHIPELLNSLMKSISPDASPRLNLDSFLHTASSVPNNFKIVNPLLHAHWDKLLLSHPDYSFFQSAAWAKVLHGTYKHRPLYFSIWMGTNYWLCYPSWKSIVP